MAESYTEWFEAILCFVGVLFLNNGFFAALAGAAVGAVTAQYIAKKHRRSEQTLEELRNTNAALSLAMNITNQALNFKANSSNVLRDIHRDTMESYRVHCLEQSKKAISERQEFDGNLNFLEMSVFNAPVLILQDIVFSKVSGTYKIYALMSELNNTYHVMEKSIEKNKSIINNLKNNKMLKRAETIHLYLGLEYNNLKDTNYIDTLNQVANSVDDCILLSQEISSELYKHACQLSEKIGAGAPKVITLRHPEKAYKIGLMPISTNFDGWLAELDRLEKLDS